MPRRDILALAVFIVFCEGAGGLGALFTRDAIPTWYDALNRPWFNPPSWLFGPVWVTLYTLMAVAAGILTRLLYYRVTSSIGASPTGGWCRLIQEEGLTLSCSPRKRFHPTSGTML